MGIERRTFLGSGMALIAGAASLQWIAACTRAITSVEAHLLAEGGHGLGFHLPLENPGSRWSDLFALWTGKHGG